MLPDVRSFAKTQNVPECFSLLVENLSKGQDDFISFIHDRDSLSGAGFPHP